MHPEQTTCAIVVHNKEANYYNVWLNWEIPSLY
jgi:hypothetical protein